MALIRNKRTGETMEVPDGQLQSYGISSPQPTMQDDSSAISSPDTTQSQTPSNYITGYSLDQHQQALKKAQAAGDGAAVKQINADFEREYKYQKEIAIPQQVDLAKQNKEKADKATDYGDAVKNLDLFEKNYKEAGLKGNLVAGFLPSNTGLSPESADFDAQRENLAYVLAKEIGGQSGQGLSDKDKAAYLKLVPGRGDTEQAAANKMANIRQLLANKHGAEPTQTTIQPHTIAQTGMDVANAVGGFVNDNVVKPIGNYAQDVGTGAALNSKDGQNMQQSQQAAITAAQQAVTKSQQIQQTNPQEADRLRKVAQATLDQVGLDSHKIIASFSPDINENPALRGVKVASAITAVADAPAAIAGGTGLVKQAVTHPIQTARTVGKGIGEIATHPLETGKNIIQNDYNNSFQYAGTGLPKSGVTMADGQQPLDESGMTPKEPVTTTQGTPPQKGINDMSLREKAAKAFATSVAVPNSSSVLKSEKAMEDAFKMTTANDPRGIARELEADIPEAGKVIDQHVQNLDAQIGLQPLSDPQNTGVLDQIMAEIKKTTAGRANKGMVDAFQTELEGLLNAGELGQAGMARGATHGTTLEKMNDTRKYLTSNKSAWFSAGQPVGSPTNDQNSLDWAAANAIKKVMSEADDSGIFKQMLARQHTSFEVAPVLAQATLKGTKVQSIGTGVRKGYEFARDRIGLRAVERNTNQLPDIAPLTMADGTPPTANGSAEMLQNPAPFTAVNKPLEGGGIEPQQQQLIRDRRMKITNPQSLRPNSKKK
jgi:hypothetical protein